MPFNVNWSDFWPSNRGELQDDHDMIVLSVTRNVLGVSGVRIALGRAQNVTWWKGFRLVNAQGREIGGIFGGQDADPVAEHDYSMAEIGSAARLELWKAKFLGVHTHTYSIGDLTPLTSGTLIEFHWIQDTGGIRNATFPSAHFVGVKSQDNQARTVTVNPGAGFQLETRVINVGSTIAFDPALDFRIGSQNPQDNQTWGTNRWELGGVVAPNSGLNVRLNLTAPAQPGNYPLSLRMVQDGVTWFGDTFEFTATVAGAGTATPGKTCLLTGLAVGLGMLNHSSSEVLDGARLVRAQLQQTEPGTKLMQLYAALSESGELESLIASDAQLLVQCLAFAGTVAECAHRTPPRHLLPVLAREMPAFERIVDELRTRSTPQTQERLAEALRLWRAVAET